MKKNDIEVLYEDKQIIVCVKPHGIATQSKRIADGDMVSWLKNYLYQEQPEKGEPYLAVIHRLDQPVRGILVFAKTKQAAKELNRQLQGQGFGKYYRALVDGVPEQSAGVREDYLVKDGRTNTSRVCSADTPGAKLARLYYEEVSCEEAFCDCADGESDVLVKKTRTLLNIHLDTGRHHQIRVQLAGMGCPIVGDTKYNQQAKAAGGWHEVQLCAYRLDFEHPVTHEKMHFRI